MKSVRKTGHHSRLGSVGFSAEVTERQEQIDRGHPGAQKHTLNSNGLPLDTPCALWTLGLKVSLGRCQPKELGLEQRVRGDCGNVGMGEGGVFKSQHRAES